MATKEQLKQWLVEAENAQHSFMLGQQEVQVRDSNGDMVTFSAANVGRLADYIVYLNGQIDKLEGRGLRGPLRPVFS